MHAITSLPVVNFGDKRLPERFWSKVNYCADGCWEWSASTPGPWRRSGDRVIQTNHVTRDVWEIPRVEADLDLIAAAPELLQCALAFEAYLLGSGCTDEHELVLEVRAAIAKARGGR